MSEGALASFIPYVTHIATDAYCYFVGQATSKSRSRREYLILTDNIIVLDHFLI